MKNLNFLFIVLITLLLNSCTDKSPVIDKEAEKVEVQKTLVSYFDALSARDWKELRALSSNDFILLENGLIWNNDSLINGMETHWKDLEITYKFEFVKTEIDNSMAWAFYHNYATALTDSSQIDFHWVENVIFSKENSKWKMNFAQSTPVGKPVVKSRTN